MSNCNKEIHDELVDIGEDYCPFCDHIFDSNEKLKESLVNDLCCDKKWKFLKKNQRIVLMDDSNEKLKDSLLKYYLCCKCPAIINDNGMPVCNKCGIVQGYNVVEEYVDFYKNRHRLNRKSVYHREYHINNAIMDVKQKYNIEISYHQKYKIDRVLTEIGNILNEVNGKRKRMISINFILRKVLSMMDLPFDDIPISKSKKH